MDIFEKGDFRSVPVEFRTLGFHALSELYKFQEKFDIYDTDTTINSVRDAIIANYLGYDLLNWDKHGFDAKKSKVNEFLEVKQCSISSGAWGGTWNDTNEEKALAFSDKRLFTVVGVWKGAHDLQFMVYGQHPQLGKDLYRMVTQRKKGSRSTQSISIQKMIKEYQFQVICPPNKGKEFVYTLLVNYSKSIVKSISIDDLKELQDI